MVVSFVDMRGIVDDQCLNFLFISVFHDTLLYDY